MIVPRVTIVINVDMLDESGMFVTNTVNARRRTSTPARDHERSLPRVRSAPAPQSR